jgi:hypothetical protein
MTIMRRANRRRRRCSGCVGSGAKPSRTGHIADALTFLHKAAALGPGKSGLQPRPRVLRPSGRCTIACHLTLLHCTALQIVALHCRSLHCIADRCTALQIVALHCMQRLRRCNESLPAEGCLPTAGKWVALHLQVCAHTRPCDPAQSLPGGSVSGNKSRTPLRTAHRIRCTASNK